MNFYQDIKEKFLKLVQDNDLISSSVQVVSVQPLTPGEVIGRPERNDFPLFKGKELMMQATFKGSLGQAYTDMPGNYRGALNEIINLSLNNNFERAVFISTLNAILRYLGYISGTIHCKDKQPEECASHLLDYIRGRFGKPRIAFIGMQPAMVEILAEHFKIRVIDLDPDNIGQKKFGVLVEDSSRMKEVLSWADLVFATGTTVVNNTIHQLFRGKPIVFYGVTIAGIAFLKGYERYCFCSS